MLGPARWTQVPAPALPEGADSPVWRQERRQGRAAVSAGREQPGPTRLWADPSTDRARERKRKHREVGSRPREHTAQSWARPCLFLQSVCPNHCRILPAPPCPPWPSSEEAGQGRQLPFKRGGSEGRVGSDSAAWLPGDGTLRLSPGPSVSTESPAGPGEAGEEQVNTLIHSPGLRARRVCAGLPLFTQRPASRTQG